MKIQEQAINYLEQGYSVIPLVPKGKKALVNWEEYQNRKATVEEVNQWFSKCPDANIGIVTGKISGVVVIDVDSEEALKLAQQKGMPTTLTVKTGKGYHFYFKYKEGVRNFQKRADLPGIDLRGEGGQAVAPPSVHENGKIYEWLVSDVALAELPEWILAKDESEKVPLKDIYKGVAQGQRNMSLARLVGSCVNDGLALDECNQMALAVNKNFEPPLSEREVLACVKSIFDKHHREKAKKVEAIEARDGLEGIVPSVSFALDVFPKPVEELIHKIAEAYSINPEPVAVMMLSLLSAAIGNTVRVSPKEGWEEPVFIWAMVTGESGSGKTPFASKLLKVVHDLQGQAKQLLPTGESTSYDEGNKIELQPQYFVSDTTIEALSEVLIKNPRGMILYFDELAGFIKSHDKYNTKGNDRQKYLELWSSLPWQVNRIGRGSIYIKDTGLSICGGIQLAIIPNVFDKFSMDDGLLPRFLFSSVKNNMNYSRSAITEQDIAVWNELVLNCYRITLQKDHNGYVVPMVFKLSEEAHQIFGEFYSRCLKSGYYAANKSIKVFIPKLISYALRIAGILHVLNAEDPQQPLSVQTISNSIKLIEYFQGEVRKILVLYSHKTDLKNNLTEIQIHLIKVLWSLKDEVKNGMLITEKIMEEFNGYCHPSVKKDVQGIAYALIGLSFTTKQSGGHSHLIWEPEKLNKLYSQINRL